MCNGMKIINNPIESRQHVFVRFILGEVRIIDYEKCARKTNFRKQYQSLVRAVSSKSFVP